MKTYKDWICRYYSEHEDDEEDGVILQELVRCKDCRHRIVTASIEHNDGEVTKYYMCEYWHRPTDPEGFCHMAKRARYSSD